MVNNKPPSSKKNRTGLIVGVVVGVGVLSFLSVFVVFYIVRRRKQLPTNDDAGKSKIILYIYALSKFIHFYSTLLEIWYFCLFVSLYYIFISEVASARCILC